MKKRRMEAVLLSAAMAIGILGGCGSTSAYSGYESAYQKMTAAGGLETNFTLCLDGDGTQMESTGNMTLKNEGNATKLYYEMKVGDKKIIQFSDGSAIYTDDGTNKTKFSIAGEGKKPEKSENESGGREKEEASEFNTQAFIQEFSGMLEAGKIKELGILDQIPEKYVKNTSSEKNGANTIYTLTFTEALVKNFLNILVRDQVKDSDNALTFGDLKDFTYTATANGDGVLCGISYAGTVSVTVPAGLMTSGEAKTFELTIDLLLDIVNPGEPVELTLPDTSGYQEL